ncbi:MAG TPA: type II toxin-antitoxin system VapC family toxin [Terrimesophilobacter sp.]|nr:type II toxin-antitoxin system VapC family toxin [Terrimesophilobacter sp.]
MIYLDSCIIIYAIEDHSPRGDTVRQNLESAGDTDVAISPLVTLECLVGPLRDNNRALHDHYLRALKQFRQLDLEPQHYLRAAELRAHHGIRTPDALHLAAAQMHGCEQLWTNDNRLAAASAGLATNIT